METVTWKGFTRIKLVVKTCHFYIGIECIESWTKSIQSMRNTGMTEKQSLASRRLVSSILTITTGQQDTSVYVPSTQLVHSH